MANDKDANCANNRQHLYADSQRMRKDGGKKYEKSLWNEPLNELANAIATNCGISTKNAAILNS